MFSGRTTIDRCMVMTVARPKTHHNLLACRSAINRRSDVIDYHIASSIDHPRRRPGHSTPHSAVSVSTLLAKTAGLWEMLVPQIGLVGERSDT